MKITIEVENTYAEGHECKRTVTLDAPDDKVGDTESDFWDDDIWQETGCTCGEDVLPMEDREHSVYEVKVIEAENPALVGLSREWS